MTIVKLDGTPHHSALTVADKDHQPDRVERLRKNLSKELGDMQEGWRKDMQADPKAATTTNDVAIDRHWDDRWRARCRAVGVSLEAVQCDPEAMTEWIKKQRLGMKKERVWTTPFGELHDLDDMPFRLVGMARGGRVYLSSHVALLVEDNNNVDLYLLEPEYRTGLTSEGLLWKIENGEPPIKSFIDYLPKELFSLLSAMRADKMTFPTEDEQRLARRAPDSARHPSRAMRLLSWIKGFRTTRP